LGCLFALFGILIIYASTLITSGTPHKLQHKTFPMGFRLLLLICGSALAVKCWGIREADLAIKWPDREGVRTILRGHRGDLLFSVHPSAGAFVPGRSLPRIGGHYGVFL